MIPIVIANKHTYIHQDGDYSIPIYRPFTLGNPFLIPTDGSRLEVVERYRVTFKEKIGSDARFKKYLDVYVSGLRKGIFCKRFVLMCYCYPKPCHGEIIKEYLESQL